MMTAESSHLMPDKRNCKTGGKAIEMVSNLTLKSYRFKEKPGIKYMLNGYDLVLKFITFIPHFSSFKFNVYQPVRIGYQIFF